jgi:molecular chaperone GrpE
LIFAARNLISGPNPRFLTNRNEAMAEDMRDKPDAAADPAPGGDGDKTAALAAEAADLKDRLLRTLAEMENLRRRTEREIADTRAYAVTNFARDMLVVGDNLTRAIAAVPPEARDGRDPALNALIEGVEVTERGLAQTLQKFGVKLVDAKGQKFDPAIHQAMYEVETADMPAGHVAEVVQAGYVIGERTLRPALVAVSKAPATPTGERAS